LFQLDLKSRKPICDQVVDNLRGLIVSGALAPDEKLPSVRELSKVLTVNPNTIQKAYRQLENLQYTYTVPGLGTFVAELKETPPDPQKISAIKNRISGDIMELLFLGLRRQDILALLEQILNERGGGK